MYFWALVSALGTFWLGAGVSMRHSIEELINPTVALDKVQQYTTCMSRSRGAPLVWYCLPAQPLEVFPLFCAIAAGWGVCGAQGMLAGSMRALWRDAGILMQFRSSKYVPGRRHLWFVH